MAFFQQHGSRGTFVQQTEQAMMKKTAGSLSFSYTNTNTHTHAHMVASEDLINKKKNELPKLYANNGNLLLLSKTVTGSAGINVALAAQNALAGLQSISPAQNSCIVKDNLQSEDQINIKCCIKTLRGFDS